jgi:hypothetical protein
MGRAHTYDISCILIAEKQYYFLQTNNGRQVLAIHSIFYFLFPSLFLFAFLVFSVAPQWTAYRELPTQMAAHLRSGCPLKLARLTDTNPGLESGVATNEPPQLPLVTVMAVVEMRGITPKQRS